MLHRLQFHIIVLSPFERQKITQRQVRIQLWHVYYCGQGQCALAFVSEQLHTEANDGLETSVLTMGSSWRTRKTLVHAHKEGLSASSLAQFWLTGDSYLGKHANPRNYSLNNDSGLEKKKKPSKDTDKFFCCFCCCCCCCGSVNLCFTSLFSLQRNGGKSLWNAMILWV